MKSNITAIINTNIAMKVNIFHIKQYINMNNVNLGVNINPNININNANPLVNI